MLAVDELTCISPSGALLRNDPKPVLAVDELTTRDVVSAAMLARGRVTWMVLTDMVGHAALYLSSYNRTIACPHSEFGIGKQDLNGLCSLVRTATPQLLVRSRA